MASVGLNEIAMVLNISARRVQQLAAAGVISRQAKGKYDALECAARYIRFLQEGSAGADVSAQRARLPEAQAQKVERENRVADGEFVPIAEYRRRMAAMITTARSRLLQMPGRVAPQLVGESQSVIIRQKIMAEVISSLAALAEAGSVSPWQV